jgi:hypothetical protein
MIIQTQIIKPLMAELFGEQGGNGGWFGSLFGGGGGNEAPLSGMGGGGGILGSVVGLIGGLFHEGGRVGFDAVPARLVSPEVFAWAPRLHQGLLPDEYPAILQKGETVSTPEQMAAMGKGKQITLNMHIVTPNADSFRKAQGQIMAEAAMALQRGQRNL